ncbi:sulfurtransferase [Candidatus Woesearchaeota archaeon CG11_big_fil_rev_8_21_14_0_20_43_8]|nr:MAG: sulfurtransferase [Candidatus Woesearchaeota archaeon CG11_big_fil_rev_8_21_14_0_20_43_8]PIO04821.1 MAG: rhodanese-like domain-containing protein [Candidatus Woesearchaeota archaeon CG08_land_8_20_14_0_20_43_7]
MGNNLSKLAKKIIRLVILVNHMKAFIDLDPKRAMLLLDKDGAVAIDVRTTTEFSEDHINGAINISIHECDFTDRLKKLPKENKYLVYCRSGRRSARAMALMRRLGFSSVFNLAGGMIAWHDVGL